MRWCSGRASLRNCGSRLWSQDFNPSKVKIGGFNLSQSFNPNQVRMGELGPQGCNPNQVRIEVWKFQSRVEGVGCTGVPRSQETAPLP